MSVDMKNNTTAFIPSTLPTTGIPSTYLQALYVFLDLVITKQSMNKFGEYGFVPLNNAHLRNILGRHKTKPVKDIAVERGFVKCNRQYIPGRQSRGYAITDEYLNAQWIKHTITDPVLFQRIWHKSRVWLSNSLLTDKWQRWLPKL